MLKRVGMLYIRFAQAAVLTAWLGFSLHARAQDPAARKLEEVKAAARPPEPDVDEEIAAEEAEALAESAGRLNMSTRTLGGKQLWGDRLVLRGWRVQKNAMFGYCRLLDPEDRRRGWGTFDECAARFDELKKELKIEPYSGRVVVLLHGLGRSRSALNSMSEYLTNVGGLQCVCIGYPSTRGTVGDHAKHLASVVANLGDDVTRIDFVAHSLGNLVIRHYLADHTDPARKVEPDARIKRIVMLGPPNHGARMAEVLIPLDVTRMSGAAAEQLANGWKELEPKLATPKCEFGIIAGGRGEARGFNPILAGDDDSVVSVESTRLAGAADFRVVPTIHTVLLDTLAIQKVTLTFLERGCFETEETRQPIPK